MRDVWRVSGVAVALIVLLRLAIGWQFVYEGLWKLNTYATPKPWTSAGYLRAARGPFRQVFRNLTGDPDDLHWLDYDEVARCLDNYRDAFLAQHPDLDDAKKERLSEMLDGPEQFSVGLAKLPSGFKFSRGLDKVISYDPESKRLIVDGKKHLLPSEKYDIEKSVKADKEAKPQEVQAFLKALESVFKQSSRLSFKEQLAVLLRIDPERVGFAYRDDKTKEVVEERRGKILQYKELLKRYEEQLPKARQEFEHKHLTSQWEEIQNLRSDSINPVRALEAEFKQEARNLLAPDQLHVGPVPEPWTSQRRIDQLTIVTLIVLGTLLIGGLASRPAAIGSALLLLSFYLALPPWPGVGELDAAGPEHSYIVNKNLIEVIALLAIAAMPTGQWFGLDRLLVAFVRRRRVSRSAPKVVSR